MGSNINEFGSGSVQVQLPVLVQYDRSSSLCSDLCDNRSCGITITYDMHDVYY